MRQAVEFFAGNSAKLYATFAIPDRIMQFDADLTLLCLPAPEIEAPSPCTETAPLQLPEPARALPAPAARKAKAACEPFALKSFWIAGRRGMRRIEGLAL
jgi:hypothetical protein